MFVTMTKYMHGQRLLLQLLLAPAFVVPLLDLRAQESLESALS